MSEKQDTVFDITAEQTKWTRADMVSNLLELYVLVPIRIIWDDFRARIGSMILLLYLFMGTVGLFLVRDPQPGQASPAIGMFENLSYPFGTTKLGKDIFASIVHATPFMFQMMIAGAVFTCAVATVVGLMAGYRGGIVDRVMTTVTDIALVIPGLPLFIVLAAFLNPTNPIVIGIVLSVNRWAGLARQVRSQVLSTKTASYVEASQIIGMSTPQILAIDLLPSVMPFVLIRFVGAARGIIFSSVALFFLGVLPSSRENWGIMLQNAYNVGNALNSPTYYHWMFAPIITIALISFGLTLLAQSADRLFNPRIRARHASFTEAESDEPEETEPLAPPDSMT